MTSSVRQGVLRRRRVSRWAVGICTGFNALVVLAFLIFDQRVAWANLALSTFLLVLFWFIDRNHTDALETWAKE